MAVTLLGENRCEKISRGIVWEQGGSRGKTDPTACEVPWVQGQGVCARGATLAGPCLAEESHLPNNRRALGVESLGED
jgi:hypothetical protein